MVGKALLSDLLNASVVFEELKYKIQELVVLQVFGVETDICEPLAYLRVGHPTESVRFSRFAVNG